MLCSRPLPCLAQLAWLKAVPLQCLHHVQVPTSSYRTRSFLQAVAKVSPFWCSLPGCTFGITVIKVPTSPH